MEYFAENFCLASIEACTETGLDRRLVVFPWSKHIIFSHYALVEDEIPSIFCNMLRDRI